jgi:Tol biopolymer transport system component
VSPAQSQRLVYRRDLQTGTTILVSRATGASGAIPNAGATTPAISADGNRIVFSTFAGNLSDIDYDGGAHNDLFVRDVNAATTTLATQNSAGQGATLFSAGFYASISDDGQRVAFYSQADNLSTEDVDGGLQDVFVRDIGARRRW